MEYFRAITRRGEHSARVLQLTQQILELNPGHYTVWQYRIASVKVLAQRAASEEEGASVWDAEFAFLAEFLDENPKGYQAW
jgi:protein farnesyltransferase/geranylgeranyltransferase type-1 subunit alpha